MKIWRGEIYNLDDYEIEEIEINTYYFIDDEVDWVKLNQCYGKTREDVEYAIQQELAAREDIRNQRYTETRDREGGLK